MEQMSSSKSESALLSSDTSVTLYQSENGTESLTSEADCSCSGEGGKACLASTSDGANEAPNCKLHWIKIIEYPVLMYDHFNVVQVLELNLCPSVTVISQK